MSSEVGRETAGHDGSTGGGGLALDRLLAQIPQALRIRGNSGTPAIKVRAVTEDSRTVCTGALFVAVQGIEQDGHRYIPQAVEAGAAAVVGSHSLELLKAKGWWPRSTGVHYSQVKDSRAALAWLSAAVFGFPSRGQTVIGVTGTDGKTTTCALLEAILGESADVGVITTVGARIAGVEQETGLHVTTPEAPAVQALLAQMRGAGCTYSVVESTSFGLEQKRVAAVEYDVAALTNITHEHLDIHGSFEAYRAAKFLLFRTLFRREQDAAAPRIAVFNKDDGSCEPLQAVLAEEQARNPAAEVTPYIYSVSDAGADVYARHIEYLPDATRFELVWRGGVLPLKTRLIGEFNVSNVLCAAAVALALGISPEQIGRGVGSLPAVLGRMQRMDVGQAFLAVVDFAHSPASLERALDTLRPLAGADGRAGRLIAVFGCAGLRDRGKRRLMGQVSGVWPISRSSRPRTPARRTWTRSAGRLQQALRRRSGRLRRGRERVTAGMRTAPRRQRPAMRSCPTGPRRFHSACRWRGQGMWSPRSARAMNGVCASARRSIRGTSKRPCLPRCGRVWGKPEGALSSWFSVSRPR